MRKDLAYGALFIILLNIAGYYLVYEGLRVYNDNLWSFNENAGYMPEMIIRIPVNYHGFSESKAWESADGKFEYDGQVFRIVSKKFTQDAMYMACVKDHEGTRIRQQAEEFAESFSDKPGTSRQSTKTISGFIKDYLVESISVKSSVEGWELIVVTSLNSKFFVSTFSSSIIHPPERA
ncbi:MAG TPA: hypothetical protein PLR06_05030 [Cyclobacteriaceae bacterium]|nr:hypothetical protein [Cyclobacteriaceae bacterium]